MKHVIGGQRCPARRGDVNTASAADNNNNNSTSDLLLRLIDAKAAKILLSNTPYTAVGITKGRFFICAAQPTPRLRCTFHTGGDKTRLTQCCENGGFNKRAAH